LHTFTRETPIPAATESKLTRHDYTSYIIPNQVYYIIIVCIYTRVGNEIITHDRRRMGHIMIIIVVIQLGDACSTTDVQLLLLLFVYNGFIDVDYMIL